MTPQGGLILMQTATNQLTLAILNPRQEREIMDARTFNAPFDDRDLAETIRMWANDADRRHSEWLVLHASAVAGKASTEETYRIHSGQSMLNSPFLEILVEGLVERIHEVVIEDISNDDAMGG